MRRLGLDHLVASFADNVLAQQAAIEAGRPIVGNRHARQYVAAWQALCSHGDAGRDALVPLLDHPQPPVAVMAAVFLLRYRTERCLSVLHAWATAPGLIGFEAQQAIERWADGSWALDPSTSKPDA